MQRPRMLPHWPETDPLLLGVRRRDGKEAEAGPAGGLGAGALPAAL